MWGWSSVSTSAMPSLQSPRFLRGHAIQLSSTINSSSRSSQAACLSTTCRGSPAPVSSPRCRQTATTTAASHTRGKRQPASPVTIPHLSSQLSYVPNHPFMRSEDFLLLRDTVGKGKTCYLPTSTSSTNANAASDSSIQRIYRTLPQNDLDLPPAGQYRPAFDAHHDSRPLVHDVPAVRPVPRYTPDFHFLNQSSINPAVKNVKDFSIYRRTLPLKKYRPRNAFPRPQPLPSDLDNQHTYGFKKEEDDKFRAVLENHYGLRRMVQLAEKYESEQTRLSANASLKKIRMTRAARGHARCRRAVQQSSSLAVPSIAAPSGEEASLNATPCVIQEPATPLFKIKRFLQIPPRTCSHRGVCPLKLQATPKGGTRV